MTSPTAAERRAAAGRPAIGLSAAAIGQAALAIADADGIEGLTMRRLAERLGVGTMTLYGYVTNKDELLDLAIDAAVTDAPLPELSGSWKDQLRTLMHASAQRMARHPALVRIRLTRPVLRPEALRFGEAGVGILRAAGFSRDEAPNAFRLLYTYTVGFAALSPARADRRKADRALRELPPDEFPNLTELRPEFAAAMAGREAFDYGLERILDGLEVRLRA